MPGCVITPAFVSWLKLPRKVADVGAADRPAAGAKLVVGERVQVDFLQGGQMQKFVGSLAHEFKGFEVENVVVVHDVFLSLLLSSVRRIKTGRDGASPERGNGQPGIFERAAPLTRRHGRFKAQGR